MIFLSTFHNSIDAKGRVVVPKEFRGVLEPKYNGFVVFRSHKLSALDCFSMQKMEELSQKIDAQYDTFATERDSLESAIFADAIIMKFDKDGRVVLPEALIKHAQLASEVAFVGRGSTFQIWNPQKFVAHQEQARKNLLDKK